MMGQEKKAKILVDRSGQGDFKESISVLFNPSEYKVDAANNYSWQKILGQSVPVGMFTSGDIETLSVDLFFDTYEAGVDVRRFTNQVLGLMAVEKKISTPPICKFVWDSFQFTGVIDKVSQRFTMFLDQGTPVRATLSVTFKGTSVKKSMDNITGAAEKLMQQTVNQGDQLYLMAYRLYRDAAKWRNIANANRIDNPRLLKPSSTLTVPFLR
ncbi:CIS tube protein [Brevibacillus sp. 179-C9.3 HS]|uniref:CIS tube protein n=1 Tax=unclassified Brevibacillus TaxID=2684853 RepID=UPI0039A0D771